MWKSIEEKEEEEEEEGEEGEVWRTEEKKKKNIW